MAKKKATTPAAPLLTFNPQLRAETVIEPLVLNGQTIGYDADGNICLTDLWKAAGSPKNGRPYEWVRGTGANYIAALCRKHNVDLEKLYVVKLGRYGKTHAVLEVATSYAAYLSADFEVAVHAAFAQNMLEESNPDLSIKKAVKNFKKQGLTNAEVQQRVESVTTRKLLTAELKKRGFRDSEDFRLLSNAGYVGLLRGTRQRIAQKLGVDDNANIRDHFNPLELSAVTFMESLLLANIEKKNLHGVSAITNEALAVGTLIQAAVLGSRGEKLPASALNRLSLI